MDILIEFLEIAKSYRVEIMEILKIGYKVIVLFVIFISGYFWGAFFYKIKWKGIKMAKYRKKPIVVEAHRWFQNGDHPEDKYEKGTVNEGKLIRRYRTPALDGKNACKYCGHLMHDHGWIDTVQGGHIVCPGDWIIKEGGDIKKGYYPCKPDVFEKGYEFLFFHYRNYYIDVFCPSCSARANAYKTANN